MKNRKLVLLLLAFLVVSPLLQAQNKVKVPEKLLGNWIEKTSNRWNIGFFEQFAIYKGDFWKYKSIVFKGESANIVLTKGTKQVKIGFQYTSEELSDISFNGLQSKTYFKCAKNLPPYTTPDNTAFKDSHFQKTDSVTIKGYLRNIPSKEPFCITSWDPIKNDQLQFFADVDALGCFTIKFPLINTTQVYVDWLRMNKIDVLEPGETYFLFYDFSTKQYIISGDNERFHNEMAAMDTYKPFRNISTEEYIKRDKMSSQDFLTVKKEEFQKCINFLNEQINNNGNLSERFKYFQRINYRIMVAKDLMERQLFLNNDTKKNFPIGYMEFINDFLYQNASPKPSTLLKDYFFFIRDYIAYTIDSREIMYMLSTSEGIRFLEKEGRLKLSEEENQVIKKREEYNPSWIASLDKMDTTQRAEANKRFYENQDKFSKIMDKEEVRKFLNQEWANFFSKTLYKKRTAAERRVFDSLITDPGLKELLEVQNFYSTINDTQTSLPESNYQQFKKKITSPALVAPIENLQNYYSKLNKQDILFTESLKNTAHLKESKDADKLFAELTTPYKGKVVYMDFWGTWCSPCKEQMQYVGAVKEALKDKDVIFMYFANRSPEVSWKNVIKEYHLTGSNVVHYNLPAEQQGMIERRFSVNAFPTYILMDKTGAIINMKASRPEQKEQLVEEINKLLN